MEEQFCTEWILPCVNIFENKMFTKYWLQYEVHTSVNASAPRRRGSNFTNHYIDATMGPMASQITSLGFAYSTVYSGADQRKHQSSVSLAFV